MNDISVLCARIGFKSRCCSPLMKIPENNGADFNLAFERLYSLAGGPVSADVGRDRRDDVTAADTLRIARAHVLVHRVVQGPHVLHIIRSLPSLRRHQPRTLQGQQHCQKQEDSCSDRTQQWSCMCKGFAAQELAQSAGALKLMSRVLLPGMKNCGHYRQ